jgi:hypothetical protein
MERKEISELANDPKKILNLFRIFHQLLHVYDRQEMEKEMQKEKQKEKGKEFAGLGDKISVVAKDKDGNIKQEISQ